MNTERDNISEKIIDGSMILLGLAEASHLFALFFKQSFHVCTAVMAVLFLCAIIARIVLLGRDGKTEGQKPTEKGRFFRLLRVYPFLYLTIALFIVSQIIWYFWLHTPYLKNDITGEIVQSILSTDALYSVNPMTGTAFTDGMPLRLKILVMPTLIASICNLTGASVSLIAYSVIPTVILLLSYLVYACFGAYLFPGEGKKQAMFLLFVALIYQFGCYSPAMDSFLLFFRGYQGAAFRAGVILPYAVLCCLKKKWKKVILCALAEVCVVWTLYGLGNVVIMVAVIMGVRGLIYLRDRRDKV